MSLTPSKEQSDIVNLLKDHNVTVDSVAGSGKCHAIDTPILMYDGSIKMVQNVQVDDTLMGPDSNPRKVLSLGRGQDIMYEVIPISGETYTFNSEHILCLKSTNLGVIYDSRTKKWCARWFDNKTISIRSKHFQTEIEAKIYLNQFSNEKICEISIKNYLQISKTVKNILKLYKVSVDFPFRKVPFDPYIIGLWLGDGHSNSTEITSQDSSILIYLKNKLPEYNLNLIYYDRYRYSITSTGRKGDNLFLNTLKNLNLINNKHIPDLYKINSRQIRLELLAGLIDTDGHLDSNNLYVFSQKKENIIDGVIYLARSLGFSASKFVTKTSWTYKGIKKYGFAFKTTISGNIDQIPCKIERKKALPRKEGRDLLVTGFTIKEKGIGDYYGFELDGDHRYLLGNFTVTHNTTTSLIVAEKNSDKEILLLTYNAQLKSETRRRAEKYHNLDVHSYHSFAVANYDQSAHTDDKIDQIIKNNSEPFRDLFYDIIIADESQDITPVLYHLLCKIITDNKKQCKLMIMGDQMQSIYKFREADSRFITFSDKLFGRYNSFKWANCTLSETFRCTIPMVDFINNCMIGYKRMLSNKQSVVKPEYIVCNSYSYPSTILKEYLKLYKPSDIFVTAFSTKDKTPIKHLANYVTNNLNIPIYCSSSDQESLDSRVIENKLVFSSIHQLKGRERKAVLFIGFDESYFEYYDKVADQSVCPNELYVAVTRASERLTLVHDSKKNYLPFLKHKLIPTYTNFQYKQTKENPKKKVVQTANNPYTVSELVSYLPFSIENLCVNYLTVKTIREADSKLNVPSVIKLDSTVNGEKVELYESVSDITGVAIPAHFEYKRLGKSTLFSKNLVERNIYRIENGNYEEKTKIAMITKLKKFSKTLKDFHKNNIENIDIHKLSVNDLLKISLYYSAQQNKTDYKLKQITSFDWLTKEILEEGTDRLSDIVKGKNLLFEESVEGNFFGNDVIGEIDCIDLDNKCVYEFKCTKDLTSSHLIQLGIYMCMCMCVNGYKDFKYYLFNIFTNEVREISASVTELQEMIKILIEHKMVGEVRKSDEQFLKEFAN